MKIWPPSRTWTPDGYLPPHPGFPWGKSSFVSRGRANARETKDQDERCVSERRVGGYYLAVTHFCWRKEKSKSGCQEITVNHRLSGAFRAQHTAHVTQISSLDSLLGSTSASRPLRTQGESKKKNLSACRRVTWKSQRLTQLLCRLKVDPGSSLSGLTQRKIKR